MQYLTEQIILNDDSSWTVRFPNYDIPGEPFFVARQSRIMGPDELLAWLQDRMMRMTRWRVAKPVEDQPLVAPPVVVESRPGHRKLACGHWEPRRKGPPARKCIRCAPRKVTCPHCHKRVASY